MWAAVGATFLVFSAAIIDTLLRLRPGGYVPSSDNAAIEYVTRRVGSRAVLVGVYSRFGWHHPGPAMYYVFSAPYRLLGSASAALPLTALLINVGSIMGIAVVLHRRAGVAVMLWGLLVTAVYLRWLDPGVLRSDWNPDVPLLPFTLLVLLCWSLLNGDRWALPAVAVLGSFCVQSHVGYALGVAGALFGTAVGFLVQAVSRRRRTGRPTPSWKPWVRPALLTLAVTALLWAAPLYDELRGHPGNLTQLVHYFRTARPDWSYAQGWREMATAAGRLPAWMTGQHPTQQFLTPGELPAWTGLVAVMAVALASALAAVRRRAAQLQLLGLVTAVALAAVVAVRHVVGPLYPYLVEWTWAAGLLLWITVGFVVLDATRRRWPSASVRCAMGFASLSTFVALAGLTGVRTAQVMPGNIPAVRQLSAAVQRWLANRPPGTVRVDFASTVKPSLLGTSVAGDAMVLALDRAGVDVQVPASAQLVFGPTSTSHVNRARWVVVVAFDAGRSPRPGPGQQVIATGGGYQVRGGPAHP